MNYEILGLTLAALVFIAGGMGTIYKAMSSIRKEREEENKKVLELAKEYSDQKYHTLEQELKYHKEIHEGKVAELSEKIEALREEMRRHHNQLVDLLTKMIEKDL